MDISKRLELVAGLVSNEIIADIGTDHGYVPIYLYKQGKIKKAYACDVRKGPLEKCKQNIALYGAMVGSFLLTTAVVEVDFLSNLFGFAHLDLQSYLISLGLAFLVIPVVEIVKAIQRAVAKK